jgi:hypothetical protein
MRRMLTALLAGVVLAGGAFAASAIAGGVATAQSEDDDTDLVKPNFPRHGEIVDEVLADLVASDVITQAQADAISEALLARSEEVRAEMEQWREDHPGGRFGSGFRRGFHLGTLLEDGVIDADELAQLPDDHPLKDPNGPAAEYVEGGLTLEELQLIKQQLWEQRNGDGPPWSRGTGA